MSDGYEIVVIKSGFASKCGGSVKTWKKRWFVLKSNGFLYYYDSSDCKHEKGKIDVINANRAASWQEVTTADKLPSGVPASNSFSIVSIGRTYTCVCESSEDAKEWIDAFKRVRGQSEQKYPAPTYRKSEPSTPPTKPRPQTQYTAPPPNVGYEAPPMQQSSRPQSMPPQYGLPSQGGPPHPQTQYATSQPTAPPMPQPAQPRPFFQPGPPMPQPTQYPPQYPPQQQQGYYRPPPGPYYPQAPPPRPSYQQPQYPQQGVSPGGAPYFPPLPPPR